MTGRKKFHELSERQKRRRVASSCKQAFIEIDAEYADLSKDDSNTNHEVVDNAVGIVESFDYECDNNSDNNSYHLHYLAHEFDKLRVDSEIDYLEDVSTDDESHNEDDENEKHLDIKHRLSSLICLSNFPDIHANSLLAILIDAGLTYLPKDVQSLRNTPRKTITTSCPPGTYLHYGLEKALESMLIKYKDQIEENIEIDINIDGLPITKSPRTSLWPILGRIVNNSCNEVFLIGVYHGKEKPESQATYLDPFISELLKLNADKFIMNGRQYSVNIRCLICDSPAASYILCIKQFNGYYGCRKCTIKGVWRSRLVFLFEESELRTDFSFRNRIQSEHHLEISAFERLNFDMVKQVPLDYMHLVLLGVTKTMLRLWIDPKTNPNLHILQLDNLSNSFVCLRAWVPKEFARKPQPLLDLGHWKATTFRLFLLYAGPIILQDILPDEYTEHFNFLSCAIRILCHPTLHLQNNESAKELLIYFVRQFKCLYGENYVTWNMHNLVHIADDAKNFGPLDRYSAFPFENYMQVLKRMIRKKGQILPQIHRRLTEKKDFIKKVISKKQKTLPLMTQRRNKSLPTGYSCHCSLKFSNFELKDQRPNNCCITVENQIIVIERICKKDNKYVIIGREFLSKENIKNYPLPSLQLGICQVDNLSETKVILVENIRNKACLFFHNNKSFVVPLLHHE